MSSNVSVKSNVTANDPIKLTFANHSSPLADEDINRFDRVLDELQGNILRPHGRNYSNHCLISFRPGLAKEVRDWRKIISRRLISAKQQLSPTESARVAREKKQVRDPFMNLLLSANGYRYLDLDPSELNKPFVDGMKQASGRLNDDPTNWETSYQADIHVMCVLADDDKSRLETDTRDLINKVSAMTSIDPVVERGEWKWREDLKDSDRIEHFGYRDGRSNPVFFKNELEDQGKGTFTHWESGAGPNLVCVPDPFGNENGCGCYFVFQKLEQDVKGFDDARKKLASELGMSKSLAGAFWA